MDNNSLRKQIITQRKQLSNKAYEQNSEACFDLLVLWDVFLNAKRIGLYASAFQEVNTMPIIQWLLDHQRQVYLPCVLSKTKMAFFEIKSLDDLKPGRFGILTPKNMKKEQVEMDLMLVPLVAYDDKGYRLGMGGGYYDRYLEKHPVVTCGLAYTFQNAQFEVFSHDHRLHYLINEKEILAF